jgi:hypothetical protein
MEQLQPLHDGAPTAGLGHVVDREHGDAGAGHRLHLDPCPRDGRRLHFNADPVLAIALEVHADVAQREGVT